MAAKNTVASVNARVDALESKLDAILAALNTDAKPAAKPKAKADTNRIKCRIPGKPKKAYVERDWAWIQWDSKPSQRTLDALKAGGWHYSVKRNAWHHVNVAD